VERDAAIRDFRGDHDLFGHVLEITEERSSTRSRFANYVMGEATTAFRPSSSGPAPWTATTACTSK
jgi:hypothetical protein